MDRIVLRHDPLRQQAQSGNQFPAAGLFRDSGLQDMKARCVMNFGYTQPFSFKLGAQSGPKIASIRHGVTEITLSDGRLVRATLHVKAVTPNPKNPDALDISYNVITEVMAMPSAPILDVHETIQ
jgi:hypothetical protein